MIEVATENQRIKIIKFEDDFDNKVGDQLDPTGNMIPEIIDVIERCNGPFNFDNINVCLSYWEKAESPSLPITGNGDDTWLEFVFYPNYPDFVSQARTTLPSLLSHEFAHMARYRSINNSRKILADIFMDEGMATVFQRLHYPSSALDNMMRRGQADFEQLLNHYIQDIDKKYDTETQNKWAYGNNELPKFAIYLIGGHILEKYCEDQQLTIPSLVSLDATEFRRKILMNI